MIFKYGACEEKPKETLKCFPEPKNWMPCNNANKKELLKIRVLPWILLYVQRPLDTFISENKEAQIQKMTQIDITFNIVTSELFVQ